MANPQTHGNHSPSGRAGTGVSDSTYNNDANNRGQIPSARVNLAMMPNSLPLCQQPASTDNIDDILRSILQVENSHLRMTSSTTNASQLRSRDHVSTSRDGVQSGHTAALNMSSSEFSTNSSPRQGSSLLAHRVLGSAQHIPPQQQRTQSPSLDAVGKLDIRSVEGKTGTPFDDLAVLSRPTADIEFSIQKEWPADNEHTNFLAQIRIQIGELVSGWYLHAIVAPNVTIVGQGNMRCIAHIGSWFLFAGTPDNTILRPGESTIVSLGGVMPAGMTTGHMLSITLFDAPHMAIGVETSPLSQPIASVPSATRVAPQAVNSIPPVSSQESLKRSALSLPHSLSFLDQKPSAESTLPQSINTLNRNVIVRDGHPQGNIGHIRTASAHTSPTTPRSLHSPYMRSMSAHNVHLRSSSPLIVRSGSQSLVGSPELGKSSSSSHLPNLDMRKIKSVSPGAARSSRLTTPMYSPSQLSPTMNRPEITQLPLVGDPSLDALEAHVNMLLAQSSIRDIQQNMNLGITSSNQGPVQSFSLEGHMSRLGFGVPSNNPNIK